MANLVGIYNENDFYSHHYLTSVFESDIRGVMDEWASKESDAREFEKKERALGREPERGFRAPYSVLATYAGSFFKQLNEHGREKEVPKRLQQQRKRWSSILAPLGYQLKASAVELDSGLKLPVLAQYNHNDQPFIWVVEAHDKFDDDSQDPLSLPLLQQQLDKSVQADSELLKKHASLLKLHWQEIISKHVLTDEAPPRWILLLGNRQALLIDRTKWAQNRLLRFDFEEILGRKETETLKACAALLHKDSVMPESGQPLLDNLDENSHKHAFSVSEDLKYALRESIELLGNEATQYLIKQGKANYTGNNAIKPEELSRECLRYMYRLLFLFYIEARPELEYAPLDSMTYLKGYSLENLRDLELIPLYSEADKQGRYIHDSLNLLFRLIHKGYKSKADLTTEKLDVFSVTQLDSHLFDPKRTPTLNKVVFTNQTMQRILNLMSLSKEKSGKKRRGRISYAQLGINQLGAVYEALLSYRGFFAQETLYEVKKKGDTYSELETGYFVSAEQFGEYDEEEKVTYTVYEGGEKKTRYKKFEKGTFIYRMAGRDREKSASYYTPEVLTKSLVKYALKELFKEKIEPLKTSAEKADAIIKLTVCEPAMGSAAFLNEAINQLSEHYLYYKQQAENKRISQDEYTRELQRVKMYIADNNVFGVDLNPVAVELAEVSLWLNAISSEAFVPWFGYQLFNGNSLIGARRQVFPAHQLTYKNQKSPSWLNQAPVRIEPRKKRESHQVYHFLLGDSGMANYTDKVVKGLKPQEIKAINDWRREFNKPWSDEDKSTLQRISQKVDVLWEEHTKSRALQRKLTTDELPMWPNKADAMAITNMETKDKMLEKAMTDGASSYQRLKMVMDYWCALWFWPIELAEELPERFEYLSDIETLLDGYVQTQPIEIEATEQAIEESGFMGDLFAHSEVAEQTPEYRSLLTTKGTLNKKVIFDVMPRAQIADSLAETYRYFHWELEFADIFDLNSGFDLVLGNPPWLKVEWQESGILSDINPKFTIDKMSAVKISKLRDESFRNYSRLEKTYLGEYIEAEGAQNFYNAVSNYPELVGQKANLYKCFLPLTYMIKGAQGVSGLIHPDGVFDDPNGGEFRVALYKILKYHFAYQNQLKLFVDVNNPVTFSLNIYGNKSESVDFYSIFNLFHPSTVDDCFSPSDSNKALGIKKYILENGSFKSAWELAGNKSRLVKINNENLRILKQIFEPDESVIFSIKLPSIHSIQVMEVLRKISLSKSRIKHFKQCYFSTQHWNQVTSIEDGDLYSKTSFCEDWKEVVLQGAHINLGRLIHNNPKAICDNNRAYEYVNYFFLNDNYIPRTNFKLNDNSSIRKHPISSFNKKAVTESYRLFFRGMLDPTQERTLISVIAPKQVSHVNSIRSYTFDEESGLDLALIAGAMQSVPFDFLCKVTGKSNLHQIIDDFPLLDNNSYSSPIKIRALLLNVISENYNELWSRSWNDTFNSELWAKSDSRLDSNFFSTLSKSWSNNFVVREDFSRRQLLIEIDVLVAMSLNLELNELLTIYVVQFPVMKQYDLDTWFDRNGHIVFTTSKGLIGVGLDRKYNKKSTFNIGVRSGVFVEASEQITKLRAGTEGNPWNEENGQIGWEDIKDLKSGIVTKTYMDDTVPDGPVERTIEYHAPFDRCDREEDYRVVWAEFERRFGKTKE
ncbi:Eco57I restriction-modification methylase domain-containing protein [Alteromonas macleodii]|uniref:Eco57I restriction-modification methylase domain-containing protein n=1 Tax=Alteromonas macleodii TaxID=28108 RepID=UPI00313FE56F